MDETKLAVEGWSKKYFEGSGPKHARGCKTCGIEQIEVTWYVRGDALSLGLDRAYEGVRVNHKKVFGAWL